MREFLKHPRNLPAKPAKAPQKAVFTMKETETTTNAFPPPPLEWLATTAAHLLPHLHPDEPDDDTEGLAVEQAARIWQRSAAHLAAPSIDFAGLAFEPGDDFEQAAAATGLHPTEIPYGQWIPVAEVAMALFRGVSAQEARERFEAMEPLMGAWAGHYRNTSQAGLEFSPFMARELWKARQTAKSTARAEAGRTRAALDAVNLEPFFRNAGLPAEALDPRLKKGASPPAKKATTKRKPCKRHRWETTGSRRDCRACGLQQVKNVDGDWVDRKGA